MRRRAVCVGFFLVLLTMTAAVEAQISIFSATADTYLKSGTPNQSQGSESFLRIQSSGNNRSLVRFDPSVIAAAVGSGSLAEARLELYIQNNSNNWGTEGRTVDAHRLAANWTEAGATWNCGIDPNPGNILINCSSPWAGGQIVEEPSDTVLHTNGLTGWVSFDVTADVRAFLSGTPNYGWMIKKTEEGQNGQVDYTSRQGTAGRAPRLVLVVESEAFDEVIPSLKITEPSQAVVINDPTPEIRIEYTDGGSGIDLGSLQVLVDATDVTGSCSVNATAAVCEPPPLTAGTHEVRVMLSDQVGNDAQVSRAFELLVGPGLHRTTFPAVADTYLRLGTPNQSQGSESLLRVQAVGRNRALVRFDQAAITAALAGATLRSAELELYVQTNSDNWGASGRPVNAHRLTAAWTESGATWSCADDLNPANPLVNCFPLWNGGTFAAGATASVLHTRGLRGWVRFDVTSDLEAFLEGAPNHGWLIKKADEWRSGQVDYTARTGAAAQAPRLVVTFELPVEEDTAPPVVQIVSPAEGSIVRTPTVRVAGTVVDDGAVASVTVNDANVSFTGGQFETDVTLAEGVNGIVVVAVDSTGKHGAGSAGVILDTTPPVLTLEAPVPRQLTNQPEILVTGEAADEQGIASLHVNGLPGLAADGRFEALVPVAEGPNTILVRSVDMAGNSSELSVGVVRFTLPVVSITSPEDLSTIAATTVDVVGSVSDPVAEVTVNGVPAAITGASFFAQDVPLIEGGNIVTATAISAAGRVGSDSINVVRDVTPPRVTIESPADGSSVFASSILVSGMVNDIVAGTVNASEATVTVNGHAAAVANRSFLVEVPLAPGENLLNVVAVDESGNAGQTTVRVRLEPPTVPRIAILSGDGQTAVIGVPLPQPLVVVLYDGAGQPVAGRPVLFKVRGGNGSLDGGKRQIAVTTDGSGRATAHFTLGIRSGAGNQRVEASSVGFRGPAVFRTTALPGAPAFLLVDAGNQQIGIAGQALPQPLVATVTDSGFNRLGGVEVGFKVVKGQGRFADGLQELTAQSDSDGRAIVPFILDPEDGIANNVVEARIESLTDGPVATFFASGWAAGDATQTSISGVILDNTNQPVPGVSARILDTDLTAQSDGQGIFRILEAPVGTIRLVIDGSTAERPGSWPDLEFVLTTIPGRDNTIGMPVYLLPLDLQHGVTVDEVRGGTLTLPEVPGFSLEILPGSVTFPGGSRSGVVSVTAVHSDKVPMVPNFGQQPRFIVTIQPAGARFEPPARLTLPNVEGLTPGQVTELYSFDHDLGHFVSIGPGTVSEDGMTIASNPGVGILKAGWHCGGDPAAAGTPADCPDCTICSGSQCVEGCSLDQGLAADEAPGIRGIFAPARRCLCKSDPNKVCKGKKCECAIPVNFRLTEAKDIGDGRLFVRYEWESSTGFLEDLAGCRIGEQVLYPGYDATDPDRFQEFTWPAPWVGQTKNPAIELGDSPVPGFLTDIHEPVPIGGRFKKPYVEGGFTATQRYVYRCPCKDNNQLREIWPKNPLIRSVSRKDDGRYTYVINKDGSTATINPLPE